MVYCVKFAAAHCTLNFRGSATVSSPASRLTSSARAKRVSQRAWSRARENMWFMGLPTKTAAQNDAMHPFLHLRRR